MKTMIIGNITNGERNTPSQKKMMIRAAHQPCFMANLANTTPHIPYITNEEIIAIMMNIKATVLVGSVETVGADD